MNVIKTYVALTIVGAALISSFAEPSRAGERLQSEQWVRRQFENHKADYFQLAALLEKGPSVTHVGSGGKVLTVDVPEYRDLAHKIGAQFLTVREDGSIEFPLSGFGCAICSDSYIGVRYVPKKLKRISHPGWTQRIVASLADASLPQKNGSVATGLYVVPIEPEWFIYRFEYQE